MIQDTLINAWKSFIKNKQFLIIIIIIEFLFLFSLTQLHLFFFLPSAEAATQAGDVMAKVIQGLPESELPQLESILINNADFMFAYHKLLSSIGFFVLSALIAWIVFKGPVWYLAQKSVVKKVNLLNSLGKFALLSLFWFALISFIFLIYSGVVGNSDTILPLMSSTTSSLAIMLALIIIFYFAEISFSLIPEKQTLRQSFIRGIKKSKSLVPITIINVLIAFVALTFPFNWIQTIPLLSLGIILCITIPLLAFTRINLITALWQKK